MSGAIRSPLLPLLRLLGLLATIAVVASATAGEARAQAPVSLASAEPFAILAGTAVSNSGATVITGDLGVSPGAAVTGFPPGVVNGSFHVADATAAQAQLDLAAAYNDASTRPVTATIPEQLGGQVLPPGVYDSPTGSFEIAGTLTLDGQGDGNGVFIFRTTSTLTTAAGNSQVGLIQSAQACNVFWQVGSSATLGSGTLFRGNVLALTAIAANPGAIVDGRLLARNAAVDLDTNNVTAAQCDQAKPAVRIRKPPKPCTARNFKARITVSDELGVRTDVFLDGRRIKRSSRRRIAVLIKAKRLAAGRHTIKAVSRDAAGNRRVKRARFNRCARAISFTG